MTEALHAILGASSSHRWLKCPGSIRLSEGMPNESSVYAREGSCAHEIAATCLNNDQDALDYLGEEIKGFEDIEVTEDMCEAIQTYLDLIRADIKEYFDAGFTDHELSVEQKFDLSHIYKGMFGTCDCSIYFPGWKRLNVYDYKHGWISVAVERNPQTMYYGVGALTGKHNRAVEEVELIIVQPRSGQHASIKRWDCDTAELLDFIADLVAGAKATEDPNAPFLAGDWCKFCPAAAICPTLAKRVEDIAMAEFDIDGAVKTPAPDKMPIDRLKLAWENASLIEGWIKNVKSYAHQRAIAGDILPGCRLVEGRSNRKWKDEAAAVAKLQKLEMAGLLEGEITKTKLKTPKQIEVMLGKKQENLISDLWEKGQGALTLVSEKDERPSAKVDAAKEFAEE